MATILHRLVAWADSDPSCVAQSYKEGGVWKSISARDYCDRVYWLALYLQSQGMQTHNVLTLLSYNCPEWVHCNLAAQLMGAQAAGIYPNSTQKDIHYVLNHTNSSFLCVQNREYYQKLVGGAFPELPSHIKQVIVFNGDTSLSSKAIGYQTALEEGKRLAGLKGAKSLSSYLQSLNPNQGAFLIYTSGTTGNPKGAILSHDNLVYTIDIGIKYWQLTRGTGGSLFSFLPLCHIAEVLQNIGGGIELRWNVNFCSKFENVSIELPQVQPTLLLCVPRLWEKMMEGVMNRIDHSSEFKKNLALWSLRVGSKASETLLFSKKKLKIWHRLQLWVADRLVLSKIKRSLGLAQAKVLVSGAAVLPIHVCRWFRALGLEIVEDFGQTESTGIICMTQRGVDCAGTIGKPVPGLEVKIEGDSEILTRGRHVFKGYFKDEKATAEVLTGGWLHTGDLGEFDHRGLIKMKGRKKEILKTSGGKMVAPLPIEEALKAAPGISQVCMVGDGRKFLSALITLTESKLNELSKVHGTLKEITVTASFVIDEIKKYIDQINESLASYEQIKRFAVLSKEFSIDSGEMTPTLKMKRNVIESHYKGIIEKLYELP